MEEGENATPTRGFSWRWFGAVVLLPLIVIAAVFAVVQFQRSDRYDPAYFSPAHLERYDTPGEVALGYEEVMRTGDMALMQELVATRKAAQPVRPRPEMLLYDLRSQDGDYLNYIYIAEDRSTRLMRHVTFVDGRYVLAEEDLYYLFDSGDWLSVLSPLVVTWWILVLLVMGFRRLRRRRT